MRGAQLVDFDAVALQQGLLKVEQQRRAVGRVDQRGPPSPEPEHDNRQVRRGQAEFAQHLPGVFGGGVVKPGRDPVTGEQVTQFLGPRGPPLADHLHRLEAAAPLAGPLPEELGDRAVELLVRGLDRAVHPVVQGPRGDRVED